MDKQSQLRRHPNVGAGIRRGPERRFDTQLVDRLYQDTEVMAKDLAQNLIYHCHAAF